jgi:eukaryotic-like serine/threonine-protein kinase
LARAGTSAGVDGDPRDALRPEDETVVDETRVRTGPAGGGEVVDRQVRRRRRRDDLWPWLLALLLLVLAGIAALWYLTREETKAVPDVTGATLEQAVSRLQDDGFKVAITRGNDEAPAGTVYEQDPSPGDEAEEGSTVGISVSEGPATAEVPDVVGTLEDAARRELEDAGFTVSVVQVFSDQPERSVVAQSPGGGEEAEKGSPVRINVSKGTGQTTVPNVVGLSEDEAKQQLEQADLQANVVEVPSQEPAGTVVAQNPDSGSVRSGSTVRLNVSAGGQEPPTTTETTTTTS